MSELEAELLKLHNRASRGWMSLDPRLCRAAQKHAEWMYQSRRLSHTGAGGSSHGQRIAAAGYEATATAENIAAGYETPSEAIEAWMSSRGHRRNIGRGYANIGFGKAGRYWCVVFADPAEDTDECIALGF